MPAMSQTAHAVTTQRRNGRRFIVGHRDAKRENDDYNTANGTDCDGSVFPSGPNSGRQPCGEQSQSVKFSRRACMCGVGLCPDPFGTEVGRMEDTAVGTESQPTLRLRRVPGPSTRSRRTARSRRRSPNNARSTANCGICRVAASRPARTPDKHARPVGADLCG